MAIRGFRILMTLLVSIGCASSVLAQFVENSTVHYSMNIASSGTFGWAVADTGDLDGDGIRDIIIGAIATGRVHVYSGGTGAFIRTLQASPVEPGGGQFGYSLADAGDADGDGVSDIVVGAIAAAGNFGAAYLFSGDDGTFIRRIVGQALADSFGSAVSGAGDINSDGFDDILIGAEGNDQVGGNSGRAYVYSGLDGSLLRTYESESSADLFGSGVASTGDINADGFTDHIIGARNAGATSGGRAYVYSGQTGASILPTLLPATGASEFGSFFVAGTGDVNNDDVPDLYVGDYASNSGRGRAYVFSGATGLTLYSILGPSPGDGQGPGRGAGDVNGDGFADFIVGRYTNSAGASQGGQAAVYSGADGSVIQTMTSQVAGGNFGFDAVGMGDINADGKLDFLVSAATGDRAYVVSAEVNSFVVPAASTWGLVVLGLLILSAGTIIVRSQSAAVGIGDT